MAAAAVRAGTDRLGYRPGLDQLRGVAVAVVVTAHGLPGTPIHQAGAVGVILFFVLSGFLITRLLVDEERRGGLDLRAFYLRRARRLLPALPLALAVCAGVNVLTGDPLMAPVLAAMSYTSNYASAAEPFGAFNHLWSLAVEEHFYLLWPAVIVVVGRKTVAPVAVTLAAAVATWRVFGTNDPDLAYQATHLRADALLIGAAIFACRWRPGRPSVIAAWCVLMAFSPDAFHAALTGPGATAVALASAVLVLHFVTVETARPALEHLGRISYGVYLFHFPVLKLLQHLDTPTTVVVGLTWAGGLALAELSWRLIESQWSRPGLGRHDEPQAQHASVVSESVGAVPSDPASAKRHQLA